jgi:Fe-S cluster biosynthesis and repair protein YggX
MGALWAAPRGRGNRGYNERFGGGRLAITCTRCGNSADPPPPHRVPFAGPMKDRILGSICGGCWKEWEGVEVKVINEYRLNFLDPEHREMLRRACADYFGLAPE